MWGRIPTALAKPITVNLPHLRPNHTPLPITLSTNRLARLSPGSAVLSTPTTTILATVAHPPPTPSTTPHNNPLLVDFRSKAAAVGVIPATWTRREQQPALFETLTARLVDRSLRPFLQQPPNPLPPTQLTISVLSAPRTPDSPLDALAANAAAAALATHPQIQTPSIAAARIALLLPSSLCIPFPSDDHLRNAALSVYASVNQRRRIVALSVHARANPVPEADVMRAVSAAVDAAASILPSIDAFRLRVDAHRETHGLSAFPPQAAPFVTANETTDPQPDPEQLRTVHDAARHAYEKAFVECRRHPGKAHRAAVLTQVQHDLLANFSTVPQGPLQNQLNHAARLAHATVLHRDHLRIDGRTFNAVRPIRCEAAALPGDVHGSALFERGDTQVLACATFGHRKRIRRSEEYIEANDEASFDGFFVHYSFPPFATGEFGRFGAGLNRREIGHSILTERAIAPLLGDGDDGDKDDFPYALRLSTDVLASDGSSSMASVCAGSVAIMDAGAPLREPVAGVALGLVPKPGKEGEDGECAILTDILGAEDHFGDMDMKIAGTASGITTCQLDVKKADGLSLETIAQAFERGREARAEILTKMAEGGLNQPREMPDSAPRLVRVSVNRERAKNTLFRDRFRGLRAIGEACECHLQVEGDGEEIAIEAPNRAAAARARTLVEDAVREVCVGEVWTMRVSEVRKSFAVIEAVCGAVSGIVHVSKMRLDGKRGVDGGGSAFDVEESFERGFGTYPDVRRLLAVGDEVKAEVIESDSTSSSIRFQLVEKPNQQQTRLASEIDAILTASNGTVKR